MSLTIAPSILSADFANLAAELDRIAAADLAHVDVMDNHFVPNLTIGLPVVRRLAEISSLPLDVHLMIDDPDRWAQEYADAGAAAVTFHGEASIAPVRLARQLRDDGVRAGLALRPASPIEPYLDLLAEFDQILVMTVEPGFGGQRFIEGTLTKIERLRAAIDAAGAGVDIQVDGGINRQNIATVARSGANVFVAGSAIYGSPDPAAEIDALRRAATEAWQAAGR